MSEMKQTPGPWYAVQPEHAHGWWIVSTDLDGNDSVDDSGDGGFREGNARLISAAPELLEVVRSMATFDGRNNNKHLKEMAIAALAKVEGRG
jgi:hypothetical protein